MNNNQNFRSDLFIHLDGIALTAPLACLFETNYKKITELISEHNITINIDELLDYNINADYLNVTLRLFESQGWLQRKWLDKNTINLTLNKYGKGFFEEIDTYKKFFSFYKDLTELSFSNLSVHEKLDNIFKLFDNLKTQNKIIIKHIEGLIIGPVLVSLFLNKYAKINQDNKLYLSDKIGSANKNFITKLFKKLDFMSDNLNLNEM